MIYTWLESFRRLLHHRRQLTGRKLIYIFHIFSPKERRLFYIFFATLVLSGFLLFSRVYISITKPVPQVGGTYTEGILGQPHTINPLFASQDADRDIVQLIYSGLLSYNDEGEIVPDLAESHQISSDNKTYTFRLRDNLFWHDGESITSEDVLFTIRAIQNPQYKSVFRANWQGVSAETLDDKTIRFTLRNPYAPFIENLTVGILPKHLWGGVKPDQAPLHELNLEPVGSGPYTFYSLKQSKDGLMVYYKLVRYKNYHKDGPYIKNIHFLFFDNELEALAAFQQKQIDGFGPAAIKQIQSVPILQNSVHTLHIPRLFTLFFNTQSKTPLSEKTVRTAISLAIDKERLVNEAVAGGAIPAYSPIPLFGSTESRSAFDQEKAKQILENAGWKDADNDGYREKITKNRSRKEVKTPLEFTLTTSEWPDLLRTSEVIQSMLKEIGIKITIEKRSFDSLELDVIKPRNFQMLVFGQVYGYEPDPFAFWHSSQIKHPGLNIASYSNKKVDTILETARKETDVTLRRKTYDSLTTAISQDIPAIFLYSQLYPYLLSPRVQGMDATKISLPSNRFNEINTWYIKTKRVLW